MKSLLPVLLLTLSGACLADLTVVADLGGESTAVLYDAIAPEPDAEEIPPAAPEPLEQALFPVVSALLQPGAVSPRSLSLPGFSPLFLIGDDPQSERWLAEHKNALLSLNATGLVVSVSSAGRLAALRQQAGTLTLLPASGDDLAKRLSLSRYPVLITATGLSQ
ncbi:integrating conjugative element protein [Salmonella enterica subsp. enterica]|nr:integrating conjugative element protein [Salmonella enterica subsp. enterica]MIF51109.1 integrating conjugative element protein [Salmonella enterica subsp. enterica]